MKNVLDYDFDICRHCRILESTHVHVSSVFDSSFSFFSPFLSQSKNKTHKIMRESHTRVDYYYWKHDLKYIRRQSRNEAKSRIIAYLAMTESIEMYFWRISFVCLFSSLSTDTRKCKRRELSIENVNNKWRRKKRRHRQALQAAYIWNVCILYSICIHSKLIAIKSNLEFRIQVERQSNRAGKRWLKTANEKCIQKVLLKNHVNFI